MAAFFRLGIIGHPLSHSLSPVLQRVFLQSAGLQGMYERWDIHPDALPDWMGQSNEASGFNVTIPHKVAILPFLTSLSAEATAIGAVNTVQVLQDGLVGHNTDAYGFIAPLRQSLGTALADAHILILGAGGASRAVAYALLQAGVSQLTFIVRNEERARPTIQMTQRLAERVKGFPQVEVQTTLSRPQLERINGVVNTTPLGMSPQTHQSPLTPEDVAALPSTAFVYDLVYNPLKTRLLEMASQRGLKTQDGLDMLIYQGAAAFQIWTGVMPSQEALAESKRILTQQLNMASSPL